VIALILEIGLLLVLIPWTRFWERNYFGEMLPVLRWVITNDYVRGAVSGLGLVNIWLALSGLADLLRAGVAGAAPPADE
jgi:hypothetical protein